MILAASRVLAFICSAAGTFVAVFWSLSAGAEKFRFIRVMLFVENLLCALLKAPVSSSSLEKALLKRE